MRHVTLIVGDPALRADLQRAVRATGYTAEAPASRETALESVRGRTDAVLIDVERPEDLDIIASLRKSRSSLPIIAFGSDSRLASLVEARRAGAGQLLRKPFDVDLLEKALASATRGPATSSEPFLTRDPRMMRLLADLERAAITSATIRIQGESGTGKDLLARFVHRASLRRAGPFVVVSAGGLSETLAESELFGHERGAFTGAVEARAGQLRTASGGTLVLDDVCDLAPSLQPKLLRVLQEREVTALGASTPEPVDLRLVVTTQKDLRAEVEAGRFREDLFFRLDVIEFQIPPLRERPDDVELLANVMLERFSLEQGTPPPRLNDVALAALRSHPFRGNVRELENLMRRATILFGDREIDPEILLAQGPSRTAAPRAIDSLNLRELERDAIVRALEARGGNRTQAANELGISVRTLRNKIRLYEIPVETRGKAATPAAWVSA